MTAQKDSTVGRTAKSRPEFAPPTSLAEAKALPMRLRASAAARVAGVSRYTIYEWARQRLVHSVRPVKAGGGPLWIDRDSLLRLIGLGGER